MTAYARPYTYTHARRPSKPALFFLLVLIIVLSAVALPAIEYRTHAVVRHGDDAVQIRTCINRSGPAMTFQKPGGLFILLCQLPDGRWGAEFLRRLANSYKEVTAYVKGDGAIGTVLSWLTREGATPFVGPLP